MEHARAYKALCDQLHSIRQPVDDTDKVHWFPWMIGSNFFGFSITQMALTPLLYFVDLISKAESFAIFQKSLKSFATALAAFIATSQSCGSST